MAMPRERIKLMQVNYDDLPWGSSEEFGTALTGGLRDLALGIAFMQATAEAVTVEQLGRILARTEALLAAGRGIEKAEVRQQAVGEGP